MRVRIWSVRGDDRKRDDESPVWRDLEEHARELEAMARAIRHDVARRNASTASQALGHMMRQSQHAYDQVGTLLSEPEPVAPRLKTPAYEV
jgi:hypothetical protein